MNESIAAQYRIRQGCASCTTTTLCPDHIDTWTAAGTTR